ISPWRIGPCQEMRPGPFLSSEQRSNESSDLAPDWRTEATGMREGPAHPEVAPASSEAVASRDSFTRPVHVHSLSTHCLISLLYEDLEGMAAQFLSRESRGHSMEAADLIHESFLKLEAQIRTSWKDRTHFLAVSAQAMSRILI